MTRWLVEMYNEETNEWFDPLTYGQGVFAGDEEEALDQFKTFWTEQTNEEYDEDRDGLLRATLYDAGLSW